MKRLTTMVLTLTMLVAGVAGARAAESSAGLFDLYGSIHQALASDSATGVAASAARLADLARENARADAPRAASFEQLGAAAAAMKGDDLAALREQFKAVSSAMAAVIEAGGIAQAQLYYCPMAKAYWVQKSGDDGARNPYYGKSMLKCGAKVEKIGS